MWPSWFVAVIVVLPSNDTLDTDHDFLAVVMTLHILQLNVEGPLAFGT